LNDFILRDTWLILVLEEVSRFSVARKAARASREVRINEPRFLRLNVENGTAAVRIGDDNAFPLQDVEGFLTTHC
jgi:hypothetical protein